MLMSCLDQVCEELGAPVADEKTEGPTIKLVYLGYEIDTVSMLIRIPHEKLLRLKALIDELLVKSKVM